MGVAEPSKTWLTLAIERGSLPILLLLLQDRADPRLNELKGIRRYNWPSSFFRAQSDMRQIQAILSEEFVSDIPRRRMKLR